MLQSATVWPAIDLSSAYVHISAFNSALNIDERNKA